MKSTTAWLSMPYFLLGFVRPCFSTSHFKIHTRAETGRRPLLSTTHAPCLLVHTSPSTPVGLHACTPAHLRTRMPRHHTARLGTLHTGSVNWNALNGMLRLQNMWENNGPLVEGLPALAAIRHLGGVGNMCSSLLNGHDEEKEKRGAGTRGLVDSWTRGLHASPLVIPDQATPDNDSSPGHPIAWAWKGGTRHEWRGIDTPA